jgi:hypothetical protein
MLITIYNNIDLLPILLTCYLSAWNMVTICSILTPEMIPPSLNLVPTISNPSPNLHPSLFIYWNPLKMYKQYESKSLHSFSIQSIMITDAWVQLATGQLRCFQVVVHQSVDFLFSVICQTTLSLLFVAWLCQICRHTWLLSSQHYHFSVVIATHYMSVCGVDHLGFHLYREGRKDHHRGALWSLPYTVWSVILMSVQGVSQWMIQKFLFISQAIMHLQISNMWPNFTDIRTFWCL